MQVGFARVIWAEYIAPILLLTVLPHQRVGEINQPPGFVVSQFEITPKAVRWFTPKAFA